MSLPALYLDEDAQSEALIHALRARGMDVLTTSEARAIASTDEEQLRFASNQKRVLVTYNVSDFARLHSTWITQGYVHSGIILLQQQKWSPGELARRIIQLLSAIPGEDLQNRAEYLAKN